MSGIWLQRHDGGPAPLQPAGVVVIVERGLLGQAMCEGHRLAGAVRRRFACLPSDGHLVESG